MSKQVSECPLCGWQDVAICYNGTIRAGRPGQQCAVAHSVCECSNCGIQFLWPATQVDYRGEQYRQDYNGSADIENYFELHDGLQFGQLCAMGESFRGKVVADVGCGGGSLSTASKAWRRRLSLLNRACVPRFAARRGHRVFCDVESALSSTDIRRADVALSLHVIEHVERPTEYLADVGRLLRQGGVFYLATPNRDDVLMRLGGSAFCAHFYRTAHLWYFSAASLEWAAKSAGFERCRIFFQHNYDLSNTFCWLLDKKPTGTGKIEWLDSRINAAWKQFLEANGMADVLWAKLSGFSAGMSPTTISETEDERIAEAGDRSRQTEK